MTSTEQRTCSIHKDGVCALHGVEIERRKSAETVSKLEMKLVQKEIKNIPPMLTKINTMIGYSLLATILIVGGFYYTSELKADSRKAQAILKSDIEGHRQDTDRRLALLADQVSKMTVTVTRNEEKHKALIEQMRIMNNYLGNILAVRDAPHIEDVP